MATLSNPERIDIFPWCSAYGDYVTEISDLQANDNPPMPETGSAFPFAIAGTERDGEDEIICWYHDHLCKDGIIRRFTVYND